MGALFLLIYFFYASPYLKKKGCMVKRACLKGHSSFYGLVIARPNEMGHQFRHKKVVMSEEKT